MKYIFGVDIGGTTVKMGFFTEECELLKKWEIPTDCRDNGEHILEDISLEIEREIKERNLTKEDIIGVGLGIPGPVDSDGMVYECSNLGWGVFNIEEEVYRLTGLKSKGMNDALVAALGEVKYGAGNKYGDIVMITLGTGIGGAIIADGKPIYGATGGAAEVGHIIVNPKETTACGCGNKGCLEQYASASGFTKTTKEKLQSYEGETVLNDMDNFTCRDIMEAAKAGDKFSLDCANEMCDILGNGLAIIATVCNPEAFIIGGGMSKAGDFIINKIKASFEKSVFQPNKNVEFTIAELSNDAGIYGGCSLVIDSIKEA